MWDRAKPAEQVGIGILAFLISIILLRFFYLLLSPNTYPTALIVVGRVVLSWFAMVVLLKASLIILYTPIPW